MAFSLYLASKRVLEKTAQVSVWAEAVITAKKIIRGTSFMICNVRKAVVNRQVPGEYPCARHARPVWKH